MDDKINNPSSPPASPESARTNESPSKFGVQEISTVTSNPDMITPIAAETPAGEFSSTDPLNMGRHRRENVTKRQMKIDHPNGNKKKLKKFYNKQNELIDQFLGADDEERLAVEEDARVAPKIKFAVNASFVVNFCLFAIQLYAAISTGSLSVRNPVELCPMYAAKRQ
jgi:hypothetical protein